MGSQSWTGGRQVGGQNRTQIQGDHSGGAAGMEVGSPKLQRDCFGETLADRIGRLPVVKQNCLAGGLRGVAH